MRKGMFIIVVLLGISGLTVSANWHIETFDPDMPYDAISLSLDSNDNPHIAYIAMPNKNKSPGSYQLKYAEKVDTTWEINGLTDYANDNPLFYCSIAAVTPNVSFVYYYEGSPDNDLRSYWNYFGDWERAWWDDSSGNAGEYNSCTSDSSYRVHVAYNNGRLKYALWDDWDWTTETVDNYAGLYTSIQTDSDNYPHISYSTSNYLKYAYQDIAGWHIETVVSVLENNGTSLAIDSSDYPHILYNEGNAIKYAYYDGSSWNTEHVVSTSVNNPECSLALDAYDNPLVACVKYIMGGDPLHCRYRDDTGWHVVVVDDNSDTRALDIAVDSQGYPHIVYCDQANGAKYAYADSPINDETDDTPTTPTAFSLYPAYPNPSSGSATIGFALPRSSDISLELFDIKGRKMATLTEGEYPAGEHLREVSGLSSGVYLYRLTADEFADTKKMVVR